MEAGKAVTKYERIRAAIKCTAKVCERTDFYVALGRTEDEAFDLACKENEEALTEYWEEVKEVMEKFDEKKFGEMVKKLDEYPELVRKLIALRPI